jgi:hypothetical protein
MKAHSILYLPSGSGPDQGNSNSVVDDVLTLFSIERNATVASHPATGMDCHTSTIEDLAPMQS